MAKTLKAGLLGSRIRATDFQDFSISETCYGAGRTIASHDHDFTYLSLVLHGDFQELVGRTTASARSASVVLMPRGVTHGERIGPRGARSVTVTLKAPFVDQGAAGRLQLEQWRCFHGGPIARIMLDAYQECLLADHGTELGVCERLLELFDAISGECDRTPARQCVAAAVRLLDARSTDGMRLGDLAADLGIDPSYLARAFRQQMSCTMSQYRRRLWVREAAHLLASTDAPLSHVALTSGFADQSHLCRVFKAEMGLSPQVYRLLAGPD
jgi:AraC family transcriptional regulator